VIVSKRIDWIFANSYLKKNFSIPNSKTGYLLSVVIFLYGIIKITQVYLLQDKNQNKHKRIPDHIVIESAAPHMHLNYFRYFNTQKRNTEYLKIECFNKKQYSCILRLSYISIFKEFCITLKEIAPIIGGLSAKLKKKGFIKEVASSLPVFAYFVCLLRAMKKNNSNLKLFSGGAPLISSAAILLDIETYYLTHGFINKPTQRDKLNPKSSNYLLVYPNYTYIYTYSKEEGEYLKLFGICSSIRNFPYKKLINFQRKVIIFLNYTDDNMDQKILEDLIHIFHQNYYEVIIKIHPTYMGNFDKNLAFRDLVRFENSPDSSADSFIRKEQPEFACGWISTTLCEALNLGVIPICLSNKDDPLFDEILYPLKKKSLMWHDDKEIIKNFIENKNQNIHSIVKKLDLKN